MDSRLINWWGLALAIGGAASAQAMDFWFGSSDSDGAHSTLRFRQEVHHRLLRTNDLHTEVSRWPYKF
jgi:hypothetical protein